MTQERGGTPSDRAGNVGDLGEDGLVEQIVTGLPGAGWLVVGPGDDAAVLDLSSRPGPLVASTDTLVEGLDFRREWSSARDVGVKVAAQNFADVAAMGAAAHTLLVSMVAPADLPASWVVGLRQGLVAECARAGAVLAGGDVSEGPQLVLTGTALGTVAGGRAVLRSGAHVGDVVAVCGRLGRSAAGLALLEAGLPGAAGDGGDGEGTAALTALVESHRRPEPPYTAGPDAARAGATAMIDTSDGLLRDAGRIAAASGVVLALEGDRLRPEAALLEAADELGADSEDWVLTGGEDHALLACFPAGAALPAGFRRIGTVGPAGSGASVSVDGVLVQDAGGWLHFT